MVPTNALFARDLETGCAVGLTSSTTGSADPIAEVRHLRYQLARERVRRRAAESIGERATADFYDSIRELRAAQADMLEREDQSRVVDELARLLREDLDSGHLVNRAAESAARASKVMDDVLESFYGSRADGFWARTCGNNVAGSL